MGPHRNGWHCPDSCWRHWAWPKSTSILGRKIKEGNAQARQPSLGSRYSLWANMTAFLQNLFPSWKTLAYSYRPSLTTFQPSVRLCRSTSAREFGMFWWSSISRSFNTRTAGQVWMNKWRLRNKDTWHPSRQFGWRILQRESRSNCAVPLLPASSRSMIMGEANLRFPRTCQGIAMKEMWKLNCRHCNQIGQRMEFM